MQEHSPDFWKDGGGKRKIKIFCFKFAPQMALDTMLCPWLRSLSHFIATSVSIFVMESVEDVQLI